MAAMLEGGPAVVVNRSGRQNRASIMIELEWQDEAGFKKAFAAFGEMLRVVLQTDEERRAFLEQLGQQIKQAG